VVALVDTNVIVYRYDPRDTRKQEIARKILREGVAARSIRIAHQAVVEFRAAVTNPRNGPLMSAADAARETELLLTQFDVVFPDINIVRMALHGVTAHQLSWYDAHMWAHAEMLGMTELLTEDFQHGRVYGGVRALDPFR
jgi:predicted nucleic acid-binding protein